MYQNYQPINASVDFRPCNLSPYDFCLRSNQLCPLETKQKTKALGFKTIHANVDPETHSRYLALGGTSFLREAVAMAWNAHARMADK